MRPLAVACAISFIIIVSGCTLQPVVTTSNGVEIESFTADFGTVFHGEAVKFRMLVRNTGSSDAAEVFAEVLGIDQDWGPNPGTEKLPNEEECRYTGSHFSLISPEPENGIPGEAHYCTWDYVAPDLDKGQSITYDITGRVFYRYESTTTSSITLGSYDEIRELEESGQSLPIQTDTYTKGPMRIKIETKGTVRFSETEKSVEFPIYVTVENTGTGTVCNVDDPNQCKEPENQNKVDIYFSGSGITFDECDFTGLTVWSGVPNYYSCEARISNLPEIIAQKTISASAEYSYYSDQETAVTVTGI